MLSKPSGWANPDAEVSAAIYLEGIEKAKKFYGKNAWGVWEAYRTASSALSNTTVPVEIKNSIAQELITVSGKAFGKSSKEYAEALLFHAQTVGAAHSSFLPHVRTAISLLEDIGLETDADREMIVSAHRALIRFYRGRNDFVKALETADHGLFVLSDKRLDWPRLGLLLERMDVLLLSERGEEVVIEARAFMELMSGIRPGADPEDVRGADSLFCLRLLRGVYRVKGADGFARELEESVPLFKERVLSCPNSRNVIIDAFVMSLLEYVVISLVCSRFRC